MKRFIKKRAGDLTSGDIVVMANTFRINVKSNAGDGKVTVVTDAHNNTYQWAESYICHTLNPKHPDFEIR